LVSFHNHSHLSIPVRRQDEHNQSGISVRGSAFEVRGNYPGDMSLTDLSAYSTLEMSRYRSKEPYSDHYCLEILRRAVVQHDDNAWAVLQQQFSESAHAWIGRHPYRELALRYEMEQNYIDDAFRRFWQAVSDQRLVFSTLGGALNYLHLCLNCAIMDTLRLYSRPKEEHIPDNGHPDAPQIEDHYHEDELWEVIQNLLAGTKERRVAYLLFHCNLKPREIVRHCPGEFRSEAEIYSLKRNITERIFRNLSQIRWKLSVSTEIA
jgi:hypothetical protein